MLFDIVFFLYALCYIPVKCLKGKWHSGLWERFGTFSQASLEKITRQNNVWIHAVSVGEVMVIVKIMPELKRKLKDVHFVISTVTKTGYQTAQEHLGGLGTVIYAPLDFSWVARKYISIIRPKLYIAAETEVWPNLYRFLKKASVPILQINGRISDRSFKGYKKIQFLFAKIFASIDQFCVQSRLDMERLIVLGALPQRVRVVGNMKFDTEENTGLKDNPYLYLEEYDLIVAGSTHPGEEEILIDCFAKLSRSRPNLRLVLCPRHPERSFELKDMIRKYPYEPVLLSELAVNILTPSQVLVIDTVGKLRMFYEMARIVFVGKTFCVGGGQNMIEPASLTKAIIVGPLTENFRDVMRLFKEADAIVQVQTPDELLRGMEQLLGDRGRCQKLGDNAYRVVSENRGATEQTVTVIEHMMGI